jgi:hypothetical protein
MVHCGAFGGFGGVCARSSFRRFKTTQMSAINEMAPITPQAHFSSGPDFGLISHTRLVTTPPGKEEHTPQRRCHLWSGHEGSLHAGGGDSVSTETAPPFADESLKSANAAVRSLSSERWPGPRLTDFPQRVDDVNIKPMKARAGHRDEPRMLVPRLPGAKRPTAGASSSHAPD